MHLISAPGAGDDGETHINNIQHAYGDAEIWPEQQRRSSALIPGVGVIRRVGLRHPRRLIYVPLRNKSTQKGQVGNGIEEKEGNDSTSRGERRPARRASSRQKTLSNGRVKPECPSIREEDEEDEEEER